MKEKSTEKNNKSTQRLVIISSAVIFVFIAIAVLLLFLPRIRASIMFNEYYNYVDAPGQIETVVITDVSSVDELLSSENGETVLTERETMDKFLDSFDDILEDMRYSGKRPLKYGGWDIRIRIYIADGYKEMYAKEDVVYILSDGVCYYFSPEDAESIAEYDAFFKHIEDMLQHKE